jgi:H+-transporting ATPase
MLAVFNDGAMIALSKDRCTPSRIPNRWNLSSIFASGMVYGLYLTLSSWAFFYVATHTTFFETKFSLPSLDIRTPTLTTWCNTELDGMGIAPTALASTIPAYADQAVVAGSNVTALEQCVVEQRYVRGAMARSALYLQVSTTGQALVFVVRTVRHSFFDRAGLWTYVAFGVAQFLATLVAVFGFNGYDSPRDALDNCVFCSLSSGGDVPFFPKAEVPLAGTESQFTASVIGCAAYVIAVWVWSIIWYMGLDPIKWALFYILDEEGFRGASFFPSAFGGRGERLGAGINLGVSKMSVTRTSIGRTSVAQRGGYFSGGVPGVGGRLSPSPAMLHRASVVRVG